MTHQKHLFNLPDDITYLNIASQSPLLKASYDAGLEGLQQKSHPHTITIADYFDPIDELKQLFAKLIGAKDYNRIASMPSASYGLATVANNIELQPGEEIIVIDEQFPSNIYIWKRLAEKYNAKIVAISAPKERQNRVKNWNEAILNAITDKTALVAMGNIHWSNGSLFDLKAIREKTKKHNALLIVDGSQSIGAFPFSIQEIQPDALVCAGYKWLFGPYGCAYAYYGPYFDDGIPIEENWSNRKGSENFAGLTQFEDEYKPLGHRYNAGEHGSFIYVQMQIAALKQLLEWSPKAIQEHCKAISKNCVEQLTNLGCHIENPEYRTHHLFGVELPQTIELEKLKSVLKKEQIYVSFRGNYIRLSSHLYNTKDDFDKLLQVIKTLIKQN